MTDLDLLEQHPALAHLNATQRENLMSISQIEERPSGYQIMDQDAEGDHLYFLLSGKVEVSLSDDSTEANRIELAAPAILGEMEFLTEEPRSASVRCTSKARLLAVPYQVLRDRVRDADPAVLKLISYIGRVLAFRLARMNEKFAEIDAIAPPEGRKELQEFRKTLFADWTV